MNQSALFTQIIILATGAFCLYIAVQLGKRYVIEPGDRLAWSAFRVWWLGLGFATALGALRTLLAQAAVDSLPVYVWLGQATTLVLCVALWGLLYYLLYLYTGNRYWAWPLGIFYGLVFLGFTAYNLLVLRPIGITLETGSAAIQYQVEPPRIYNLIIALLILAPQLLAALAYFSLFFRLKERAQKYRVLLVSLSILVWFGSPLIALALGLSDLPWWALASRMLGFTAVLVIYWAYYPPSFIQRRFGVVSI